MSAGEEGDTGGGQFRPDDDGEAASVLDCCRVQLMVWLSISWINH